jgi:single-strand DNA-binding protein
MNRIVIIGNLGRAPEPRYTPPGQMVTLFSVASNHSYTDSVDQKKSETDLVFGKLAELCNEHLRKGKKVYIEGRLKSRTYQTRDGQTRHSNDITVTNVHFLSGKGADAPVSPIDARTGAPEQIGTDDVLDLPF